MGIFDSESAHKLFWDEASQRAEERLKKEGISLPWHYNDAFGNDFMVLALRAGGFGAVFFVKSTRFGERIYAAKTLQQFLKDDYLKLSTYEQERIAKDFMEEALPWLEMGQHPNIVPVHLLENIIHPTTKRNVPFVFSEFMERGDLRHLVIEKGKLSLEETFGVGLQICEGLLHAYNGISAHKDLKPENIMVYKDGIYKVTDFSAGVLGTLGYMAPEQERGEKIDHHADQFAVGLIMHDVFKGGDTQNELRKRIRSGIKEVLSDNIPTSLRGIIARCLSPVLTDRFSEFSSLKEALLETYRGEFKKEYRFPEVEIDDSPTWWFNRGIAFWNIGRYNDAVTPYKEALRMFKGINGTEKEQAKCLVNLGIVYMETGRFPEAETYLKDALRMLKGINGTEIEIDNATCLESLGMVDMNTGRFSEAETYLKDALRIFKAIPRTKINQATCLMDLGFVYKNVGRFSEAESNYKEALVISKAIAGTEIDQSRCLTGLGNVNWRTGRFFEAEENYKEALRMFKAIPGTEINQAECLVNLGNVYFFIGRFSEAEDNCKDGLRMFKTIAGTEISQARCLTVLGNVYGSMDRFSEAESSYKKSFMIFKAILGTEIEQATCLVNLGNAYRRISMFPEAETNLKDALRMFKAIPGKEIEQATCHTNLGILYYEIQEFGKAQNTLKDALEICRLYPMGTVQIKNACLQLLDQIPK